MTIKKAIRQLVASEEFKSALKLKENAKLRVYLGRYKKGTLGNCGIIDLLLEFGYIITVEAPKR